MSANVGLRGRGEGAETYGLIANIDLLHLDAYTAQIQDLLCLIHTCA
jgi:hypothetical protein